MSTSVDDEPMTTVTTGSTVAIFIRFVIPSLLGFLSILLAGVIDGIFVGHYIGAIALAVINFVAPLYALLFGITMMILTGGAVAVGKALGAGEIRKASNLFTKSMIVLGIYAIICTCLTFSFTESIVRLLGAKGEVMHLTMEYIRTLSPFLFFMNITYALSCFVRVDDSPNFATAGLIMTALAKILLDALLIKFWRWGVFGLATVNAATPVAPTAVIKIQLITI